MDIIKYVKDYYNESTLEHVLMVSNKFELNSDEYLLSILHDILEDTHLSIENLKIYLIKINKLYLIKDVVCITRKGTETYFEYINRIKECKSVLCKKVKIADLEVNLNRKESLKESLGKRYNKALFILRG